jgi:Ca2+/Na+ antiporter
LTVTNTSSTLALTVGLVALFTPRRFVHTSSFYSHLIVLLTPRLFLFTLAFDVQLLSTLQHAEVL